MHLSISLVTLFSASCFASPILRQRDVQSYVFSGDAPYGVDATSLASILTCPYGNPTSTSKPILLVHGTGSTGNETWGFGYAPALKAKGYTPCWIDLPYRAMGDMQTSSAYIAYNLHALSALASGTPVQVMGHSQANPDIQWALHFFPSTHSVTSAYVGLSPDLAGIGFAGLSDLCDVDGDAIMLCQPSLWQQLAGSNYYKGLNFKGHTAQIPTTIIWSMTDEVVIPANVNAALPGATVIAVQDLCPYRITDHLSMVIDAAGFALATDALANGGTASLERVLPQIFDVCPRLEAKGMDPTIPDVINSAIGAVVKGIILTTPKVAAEPLLLAYAQIANQ